MMYCPTAVLIDVSDTSMLYPNTQLDCSQEKVDGCISVTKELRDKVSTSYHVDCCSEKDLFVDHSPKLSEINDQLSSLRLRWKTPSPKSMSRISKEATKVIHNLNSSEILDDDSLLTEEVIPLSINFNIFDLEDSIEQEDIAQTENNCENKILNSSVSVQTQDVIIIEKLHQTHFPEPENCTMGKNFQGNSDKSTIETNTLKVSFEGLKELDSNSKGLFTSETNSYSLNGSGFSTNTGEIANVSTPKEIYSEDKENIQRRENVIFSQDKKIKSSPWEVSKSKTMVEFRGTLKNLSNITHKITNSTQCSLLNASKSVIPPCKKLNLAKVKVAQPATNKQQMKSKKITEAIPRSNSFQSTKELRMEKPCSSLRNISSNSDSLCNSSSSDPKQFTSFTRLKTPSKRYSISTPLKSASVTKPPMTRLSSIKNPTFPKYSAQSGNSRLSLSKSWQPHTGNSSNTKGMKNQNYTSIIDSTCRSTIKINSGKLDSNYHRKMSFSQSMSTASFRSLGKNPLSTSNKSKFCSKLNLPSPVLVGQDRKLVRTLFPNVTKK